MSLLRPLGLLALIAIPIIIIIYIIKNKFTEQTIASTYIWTLSERFLKKRTPINKLQKWISLILQITAVVLLALTISNPVFYIPGQAADYCFILDGSESMQTVKNGTSRWDRGKEKISSIIEESGNGSSYTLICVGDASVIVYSKLTDKDAAIELLEDAEPAESSVALEKALPDVQKMFDADTALKTYLFTDRSYSAHDNVEIVNLYDEEVNVALISVECAIINSGLKIDGKIIAYGQDTTARISVYLNGSSAPSLSGVGVEVKGVSSALDLSKESEEIDQIVEASATDFSLTVNGVSDYQSVRIVLDDSDALASDNELVLYNVKHDTSFNTLIVCNSETKAEDASSFFIESALKALGHTQIKTVSSTDYEKMAGTDNYGLYIFNGYTPRTTPSSGAVWFFSPSVTDDKTGFAYQNSSGEAQKMQLEYSKSSSSVVKKLLSDIDTNEDIYISGYSTYTTTREFTTLLTCNNAPMLFVGSNAYGNREVVFSFNLHDSDMPLSYAYVPFFNNLLEYTFPSIVDRSDYVCGDIVKINVVSNTQSICVTSPSGEETYLSVDNAESDYTLDEIGLYKIKVNVGSEYRELSIYSRTPSAESVVKTEAAEFSLIGEASLEMKDGIYDDLIALFITLAVICIADWMVYCYEQYQLR